MKPILILILCVVLFWFCSSPEENTDTCANPIWEQHSEPHWLKDYGIGVVEYRYYYYYEPYEVEISIFSEPDTLSHVVAEFDSGEGSLYFVQGDSCVRSSRQIGWDYEISGFAIMSLNGDSSFAEVTLDPWNTANPPKGWINMSQPNINLYLWSEELPKKTNLFFLNPDSLRFFEDRNLTLEKEVNLQTHSNSEAYNYILVPLENEENSLRVEIYSPSNFCVFDSIESVIDTAWVRYLTDEKRPILFYYSDC